MAHGSELVEPVDPLRDHVRGDASAPVVVVEYGSLGSMGEAKEDRALRDELRRLRDDGSICVAFRHFPLIDSHPGALLAAQAIEAADRQGRFWDMYEALTDLFTLPVTKELDRGVLLAQARKLKLDVDRLEMDMDRGSTAARVLRDLYDGFRCGVNGAPTFYVQGVRQDIEGPEELLERIEAAVAGNSGALWPPMHAHLPDSSRAARLWHEHLALGDASALADHWAEDITWHGWNEHLPGGGAATGKAAVEALHRRPSEASIDFRAEPREFIVHGDRVLVIGDAHGDAPAGAFHVPYVQIWEMEAGKAKRVETLTDTLAIAAVFGELVPTE